VTSQMKIVLVAAALALPFASVLPAYAQSSKEVCHARCELDFNTCRGKRAVDDPHVGPCMDKLEACSEKCDGPSASEAACAAYNKASKLARQCGTRCNDDYGKWVRAFNDKKIAQAEFDRHKQEFSACRKGCEANLPRPPVGCQIER